MTATLVLAFLAAAFLSAVLIPPLAAAAGKLRAYDLPGGRKMHGVPIPRFGGIAIVAGAIVPLLFWADIDRRMAAFLFATAVLLAFGVWDDLKGMGYRLKFLGQVAAVLIVVLYGDVVVRTIPFLGYGVLPDAVAIPFTVVALVGVTNAINLADGLDGLAGGITVLSLAIIAILGYPSGDMRLLLPTATIIGGIVGFLRYNTYPARIFMGDGGSQFLGFSAGVLAIVLTQESVPALSPSLPLLILGLPILDTVMVIGERIWEGRSPFVADRNHLHYKLLARGMHHYEAVFAIYLIQTLLIAAAYLLRYEPDWMIVGAYAAFCAVLLGTLKLSIARGWRVRRRAQTGDARVAPPWIQWLREDQRILRTSYYVAAAALAAYLLLGSLFVARVPGDIGILSGIMFGLVLVMFARRHGLPFNIVERASAYVACASVVYLVQAMPGVLEGFRPGRNILLGAIALCVAVGFRLSRERFQVTTMDYLVILAALVLPAFAGAVPGVANVGLAITMLVVLFYGTELILNNTWQRFDVLRLVIAATFGVLAIRGLPGAGD